MHLFLRELKLGPNASLTAANISREWVEGSTCDRTVRRCFQVFSCRDTNLVDQEDRWRPFAFDDLHMKTLVEQKPRQCLRGISWAIDVCILTILVHLKRISKGKKFDKWVHMKSVNVKELDVCSILLLQKSNDPFFDRMVTCDEKYRNRNDWLHDLYMTKHPNTLQNRICIIYWSTKLYPTHKFFWSLTHWLPLLRASRHFLR